MNLENVLLIILFYLIGSIPSGLIIGKLFLNIDIRKHGSGNLGSTNALRVAGVKMAIPVFIMDLSKGYLPLLILANMQFDYSISIFYLAFFLAFGHCYPIFAGFKGGKAVATSLGIILFVNVTIGTLAFATFLLVTLITKYVSLGSILGFLFALIACIVFRFSQEVIILNFLLFSLMFYRHLPNVKRLLRHEESKIGQKK